MADVAISVLVDLEGILGHQADGAGDAARALLLFVDDRVLAGRL